MSDGWKSGNRKSTALPWPYQRQTAVRPNWQSTPSCWPTQSFKPRKGGRTGFFTRKALLYTLDQIHQLETADAEALRLRQMAQRASDPDWINLQKAAERMHWVISAEDGLSA